MFTYLLVWLGGVVVGRQTHDQAVVSSTLTMSLPHDSGQDTNIVGNM